MNETAFIMNTATEKSLVIMDEVGRGTGTNDGLSIAWAVSEELLNRIACRTLFATHFHELSLLNHPRLANRSMEVLDENGKIVFLRKLKEGPAAESYGIHVARLAGLSETILQRAGQIMELLKERDADLSETFYDGKISEYREAELVNHKNDMVNGERNNDTSAKNTEKIGEKSANQAFFAPSASSAASKIEKLLNEIEPEKMTPLQALNLLCEWKILLFEGVSVFETGGKKPKTRSDRKEGFYPSLFD
jgi:DNA mismatch repair protein MutS